MNSFTGRNRISASTAQVLVVALLCCGACRTSPATSELLVNRAWTAEDPGWTAGSTNSEGWPGVLRIFLSNGTLVEDSCWDHYWLSTWRMESEHTLNWREGEKEIAAEVVLLNDKELVLRVNLPDGSQEEHYYSAPVPYACTDAP